MFYKINQGLVDIIGITIANDHMVKQINKGTRGHNKSSGILDIGQVAMGDTFFFHLPF